MALKTVLFLCTGNYYRSRFAELLFNDLAARHQLNWRAASRGLELHEENVGAISHHAVQSLAQRGIAVSPDERHPLLLANGDLESADLVVALKELEHRPLLEQQFPHRRVAIEFWHIDDLDAAAPDVAMAALDDAVRQLVGRLERTGAGFEILRGEVEGSGARG